MRNISAVGIVCVWYRRKTNKGEGDGGKNGPGHDGYCLRAANEGSVGHEVAAVGHYGTARGSAIEKMGGWERLALFVLGSLRLTHSHMKKW